MERNTDFTGFPPYDNMTFNPNLANDAMYQDPMFNPIVQYEQAYMYYRYLAQQMDYSLISNNMTVCVGVRSKKNEELSKF